MQLEQEAKALGIGGVGFGGLNADRFRLGWFGTGVLKKLSCQLDPLILTPSPMGEKGATVRRAPRRDVRPEAFEDGNRYGHGQARASAGCESVRGAPTR